MTDKRKHTLKCVQPFFNEVKAGRKTFELRLNDRFYQEGDLIELECWEVNQFGKLLPKTHEKKLLFAAGPILQGGQFGLEARYCAFSLLPA